MSVFMSVCVCKFACLSGEVCVCWLKILSMLNKFLVIIPQSLYLEKINSPPSYSSTVTFGKLNIYSSILSCSAILSCSCCWLTPFLILMRLWHCLCCCRNGSCSYTRHDTNPPWYKLKASCCKEGIPKRFNNDDTTVWMFVR